MKAYVLTTGIVFGSVALMHVWRAIAEGPGLAKDPLFLLITAFAAALSLWALRVFRLIPRA